MPRRARHEIAMNTAMNLVAGTTGNAHLAKVDVAGAIRMQIDAFIQTFPRPGTEGSMARGRLGLRAAGP